MGMIGRLDTNVALYLLGGRLAQPLPAGIYAVSVITEMELLAWPSLTPAEERIVMNFLSETPVLELSAEIRHEAIRLRRSENLKLPDAIVCATAIHHQLPL
jgi:predicted nucleic acid-binding protein